MDIKKFQSLLKQGKPEEAGEVLQEFLKASVTPKEQGQALLTALSLYMEAENTINREHVRVLQNAVSELEALQKNETAITDAINIEKARRQIDSGSGT